ncbi:MAG: hypothetical protein KME64_20290 [Scytonematopsis contorta HA4267-MV1]|jgi:BMFP domain-containing protein YqiC|nr:hypothetical protein [Scytonematopsis contorta HA4267-MV1]
MSKVRVLLTLILIVILWGGWFTKSASSQLNESRFANLEAQFYRLEVRLNQVEAQLGRIASSGSASVPRQAIITPQSQRQGRNLSIQERDKMFDRLATLVIEVREQVKSLQSRVSKLESRKK